MNCWRIHYWAYFSGLIDIPVNHIDSKMSSATGHSSKRVSDWKAHERGDILGWGRSGKGFTSRRKIYERPVQAGIIELKIPILPISSLDTWKIMWDSGSEYGSRPGICNIFVHKPIETSGMTVEDADLLKDEVYRVIKQKLDENDH